MAGKAVGMLVVAMTDFTRNNCQYMAAGVAYWTLFSLFPLALAGISILGFLNPSPDQQSRIVEGIVKLIPVSVVYISGLVEDVSDARGALGGLAVIGMLWTGTAVFSAVRKGVNHAWHIRLPHAFLLERLIDGVMLLGVALLALIHVVVSTDLLGLSSLADRAAESNEWVVYRVLFESVVLAVSVGAFLLLYRYAPNTKVEWGDVWVGAVIGATLFQGVRIVFAWFISSFGNLNVVYGSLGGLMAVLVWAYLSAMAIILGAQFAYTYRGVFGSRAGEVALPEPRSTAGTEARERGVLGVLIAGVRLLLPRRRGQE